jgi:hypothetical protein
MKESAIIRPNHLMDMTLELMFQSLTPERAAHLIAVARCLGNTRWDVNGGAEQVRRLHRELALNHKTSTIQRRHPRSSGRGKGMTLA